jgi:hypothetical protein
MSAPSKKTRRVWNHLIFKADLLKYDLANFNCGETTNARTQEVQAFTKQIIGGTSVSITSGNFHRTKYCNSTTRRVRQLNDCQKVIAVGSSSSKHLDPKAKKDYCKIRETGVINSPTTVQRLQLQ